MNRAVVGQPSAGAVLAMSVNQTEPAVRAEPALHEMVVVRGVGPVTSRAAVADALHGCVARRPCQSLAADRQPQPEAQLGIDPRRPLGAEGVRMDLNDQRGEPRVLGRQR